jgi:VIT1/CCC1 family predicted Fe2+/Mn2+ transporter
MERSKSRGINFGTTSGVITTLGLMVGLISSTYSKLAVLGGIITVAIADAMSDALGMHISEESLGKTKNQVWKSTKYTFLSKFLLALTFVIPVLLFDNLGIVALISSIWGFLLLTLMSLRIAKKNNEKPILIVGEHLLIAAAVIVITYLLGRAVGKWFG